MKTKQKHLKLIYRLNLQSGHFGGNLKPLIPVLRNTSILPSKIGKLCHLIYSTCRICLEKY